MSTSENKNSALRGGWAVWTYLGVTVFCLAFSLIYHALGHGVRSPYMGRLCLWPALLGLLPALLLWLIPKLPRQGRVSANLWHPGVATLSVWSLLRGILQIAGSSSRFTDYLFPAGCVLLGLGAIAYLLRR